MRTKYDAEKLLQGMLEDINKITGKQDKDLTKCVNTLLNGNGSGGSGGVDSEVATIFIKGTFTSEHWGDIGDIGQLLTVYPGVCGEAGFYQIPVENMEKWCKNYSAREAYKSVRYSKDNNENVCTFVGTGGYELLYITKSLIKNKTYTLSLEYRTDTDIIGQYETPYAPFIGFFQYTDNIIKDGWNAYGSAYARTVLPTGVVPEYQTYQCSYKATSDIRVALIGISTGCTLDDVETTIYIKNITIKEV